MKRRFSFAAVSLLTLGALAVPSPALAKATFRPTIGKAMGLVPSFGKTNLPDVAQGSQILTVYHGGPVMGTGTVTIHSIFWAPPGYHFTGSPGAGVPGYEPMIQQFLGDVAHDSGSTSNVFSVLGQFGDNSGSGTYSIAYNPTTDSIDDTDPYPPQSQQCASPQDTATCVTDAEISAEVDHIIQTTDPSGGGLHDIWEVYLPPDVDECIDPGVCGTNDFSGYHSLADQGHGTFIYAVMIDPIIEDAAHQGNDPEGNEDAERTVDVASHETVEAITDPEGIGWMDPNGYEVADKCEFGPQYGTPLGYAPNGSPYNQVINGHEYQIQTEWSNTAAGCVQQSTSTTDGLPLPKVSLNQFSPNVSGNISQSTAGIPVQVSLLRAGTLVAQGRGVTGSNGAWGPVTLRGAFGRVHAVGDDRDTIEIDYGQGGPPSDLIATGSGGDPYAEAGWTGWLDLDTGVSLTSNSLTYGPCFQTGVLTAYVNGKAASPLVPECYNETDTATVPVSNAGSGSTVTLTSSDNRAPTPLAPQGALVALTVPVGEPNSVSAIGNDNLPFNPSGLPTCTAYLRLQNANCGGLVPGARYTLSSSRGHQSRKARANGNGFAHFTRLRVSGGDVLTLKNSAGRVLTRLHVAHLRVSINGNQTVIASGTCQPGDYWGAPFTKMPDRPLVGVGGATGLGIVCGNHGNAKGLPDATIEQVDDQSGGATSTSVPELLGSAPANDAIVYGAFRAIAQTGLPGPHGTVEPAGARVSLTITRGKHRVFHARNVAGNGVRVHGLASGVYKATWVISDANGDTRTVVTKFVEQ